MGLGGIATFHNDWKPCQPASQHADHPGAPSSANFFRMEWGPVCRTRCCDMVALQLTTLSSNKARRLSRFGSLRGVQPASDHERVCAGDVSERVLWLWGGWGHNESMRLSCRVVLVRSCLCGVSAPWCFPNSADIVDFRRTHMSNAVKLQTTLHCRDSCTGP